MAEKSKAKVTKSVGDWSLEQKIGSGSFSVVWRGVHSKTGRVAAIKEVATDRLNEKLRESLNSELAILKRTKHKNIVELHDILKEDGRIYLVLEYCAGGDLSGYIRRSGRVPEAFARHCLKQLAAGMQELRRNNLVHRDLKPQNLLLVDNSSSAVLKIADFGFARSLQPQGLAETLCGSPLYMAPEILKFHRYDAKADLWSVGTILYELVVGRPPFDGSNHLHLLQNIERKEVRMPEAIRQELSMECRSLIHRLLKRNPVERITFEEFFSDPFICGGGGVPREILTGCESLMEGGLHMGLSMVKEEENLHHSSGEGVSSATVVHETSLDFTMESAQRGPLFEALDCTQSCLSAASSDAFDKDYVMVEFPSSVNGQTIAGVTSLDSGDMKEMPSNQNRELSASPSVPRPEFLFRIASLISELALAKREGGCPHDAFAVFMLGVQLLDAVLELNQSEEREGTGDDWGLEGAGADAAKRSYFVGVDELRVEMLTAIQQSDELTRDLTTSDESTSSSLPNVHDMVFQHALSYSRGAAVDELMGNYAKSQDSYKRALDLLWFLVEEAPNLDIEPPMSLSKEEMARLQQYMVTINIRRSVCCSTGVPPS
ncbi:hypothetical protein BSKO_10741 [Bryopsis sp. KO-2023]|nr:hypothetical protein BSKO_10741 [Bryopsis sp. KO-2023]